MNCSVGRFRRISMAVVVLNTTNFLGSIPWSRVYNAGLGGVCREQSPAVAHAAATNARCFIGHAGGTHHGNLEERQHGRG